MQKHYVYSTLSTGMTYANYVKSESNDLPIVDHKIIIHGGANVANKALVTPLGVMTRVSSEDLEILQKNDLFQRHQKNGFITVKTINVDPEVVASDMEPADDSAPLTPNDFDENEPGAKPAADIAEARDLPKKLEKMLGGKKSKDNA